MDLQDKEPSDIVMALAAQTSFASLLNNIPSDNMMRVILKLLTKACETNSARTILFKVLTTVEQSDFLEKTVKNALTALIKNTSQNCAKDDQEFIKNLLVLIRQLSVSFPHALVTLLGLTNVLKLTIRELENTSIIDDEIRQLLTGLDELKGSMFTKIQSKRQKQKTSARLEEEPPDNFRDLPVCPTCEDIHPDEQKPFLRRNRVKGGYRDLNQYLDIQFRLLREDFISPLREGIDEYLDPQGEYGGQRKSDIRVYTSVRITNTVCARRALLHRLEFDVSRLKTLRWENSKRLIYGSLVCLSHDNFNTFLFASVSERDCRLLRKGIIDVSFEHDLPQGADENTYVMVETTAFFEAYRHVLKCLQQINEGQLPFERYIVNCESKVSPPKYLRDNSAVTFDLQPLLDDDFVIRDDDDDIFQGRLFRNRSRRVKVLDLDSWPTPHELHLNQPQYQALQAALTQEFVVTQGPPGTGKTYVGLKIVKALLHNARAWNSEYRSPLLIVCYTNHALDQFLEGIDTFYKGNMIRVGSRSKSEIISKYTLREKRQKFRKSPFRCKEMGRMRYEYYRMLEDLKLQIERQNIPIEASKREILHENTLRPHMGSFYSQFVQIEHKQGLHNQESLMSIWLGLDKMISDFQTAAISSRDTYQLEDSEQHEDSEFIAVREEAEILQQQRQLDDDDDDDDDDIDLRRARECVRQRHVSQQMYQYVAVGGPIKSTVQPGNEQITDQFQMQRKARKAMKRKLLKQLRESKRMSALEMRRIQNIWNLPMSERYKLYKAWIYAFRQHVQQELITIEATYRRYVDMLKEIDFQEDKKVLQRASVIGMTTTGAARCHKILSEIRPKIVVVEEAAEVLEGHVIATLSESCEHLILIGDHKQLRPNPNTYRLAKDYSLDLSLFERMVNNGLPCNTLEIQHRMRPEIANLMLPIYPRLKNSDSVKLYPSIKGISQNLFFITHNQPEQHDKERVSHSNDFEARYIVQLCSYILKQGYDRSRITVLTTYSGQLLTLQKLMPKQMFDGVTVTVVDNFQGEENDIILLSLVRSNDQNITGFLKIENRICVALSRAKHGLFVIGNFDLLSQNSELWKEIVRARRRNNEIGNGLQLVCQNHPRDAGIVAAEPKDFEKAPEGGCTKRCRFVLKCGHVCRLFCHPYDPKHLEYKCKKRCEKVVCNNGHQCTRLCSEQCVMCTVEVEKIIPGCQHKQMVECYRNPELVVCTYTCTRMLLCGHACAAPCGSAHKCTVQVSKESPERKCVEKCVATLACGHECGGNCNACHQGRLHENCSQQCQNIHRLTTISNQLEISKKIETLIRQFSVAKVTTTSLKSRLTVYLADLEHFRRWMLTKKTRDLSEQEIADAQRELDRHTTALELVKIEKRLLDRNITLEPRLELNFQTALRFVGDRKPFTSQQQTFLKAFVRKVNDFAPSAGMQISEPEKLSLPKAKTLGAEHWFKCKNGEYIFNPILCTIAAGQAGMFTVRLHKVSFLPFFLSFFSFIHSFVLSFILSFLF